MSIDVTVVRQYRDKNYYSGTNNNSYQLAVINKNTSSKTLPLIYEAIGGEIEITLTALIGGTIIWIMRGVQILSTTQFSFDITTGKITSLSPALEQYETLYITYSKIVTT